MTLFTEDGATMKYPQAGVFHFELSAVSDGQWTIEPRQMVEKNKITTTLRKMEFNPSVVDAELCLQFDNDWEWIPEATLLINNSQSKAEWTEQIDEEGNLYIAISPNRCFRFTFPVEGDLESGAPIAIELEKLKIDAFNVLTDEGCSETLLAIQQNYPDVNFACHIDFRDGGRSVGFELLSKPASMSDGQVYELFRAALQEEIEGPWRFEVNVP
jgi:hypothetical protein